MAIRAEWALETIGDIEALRKAGLRQGDRSCLAPCSGAAQEIDWRVPVKSFFDENIRNRFRECRIGSGRRKALPFGQDRLLAERTKVRHPDKGPFSLCAYVDKSCFLLLGKTVKGLLRSHISCISTLKLQSRPLQ